MRKLALSVIAIAFLSIGALAQDVRPEAQPTPEQQRPNLLQQLGLNPDQLRQIRQLNMQRKPMIDDAQRRVREANQALDRAIYADNVDENDVQAKLNDLQRAQADVARIRFTNELAIRRVLTPEQLSHFRDLRAAAMKQVIQERREQRVEQGKPAANNANTNKNLRQLIREQNQQNRKVKTTPPAQTQPKPKN
jgi:Spy/CpxP family protein refolding chaperone